MFCHSMQCPQYCSNFPELKQSKQSSYFRCLWCTPPIILILTAKEITFQSSISNTTTEQVKCDDIKCYFCRAKTNQQVCKPTKSISILFYVLYLPIWWLIFQLNIVLLCNHAILFILILAVKGFALPVYLLTFSDESSKSSPFFDFSSWSAPRIEKKERNVEK